MAEFGAILIVIFGAISLIISVTLIRAFVLSYLWIWFVVPIFNLPSIGIAQCIGVALVSAFLFHPYIPSKEKDNMIWFSILVGPFITLGFGWIVKGFM